MEYKDYYKVMGVERSASQDEIKRAHRKLARKYHPDVSKEANAEERFKEVGEAYDVLKDPEKRAAYDRLGANWKSGQDFQPPPDWKAGFETGGSGFDEPGHGRSQRLLRILVPPGPRQPVAQRWPQVLRKARRFSARGTGQPRPDPDHPGRGLPRWLAQGHAADAQPWTPRAMWCCANTRSSSPFHAACGPASASAWQARAGRAWARASRAICTWR